MSKKWFWMRALVMLVIVGLLAVGGVALYRAGWSQGYVAGQVVEGEEGAITSPGLGYPGWHFMPVPYRAAPFVFGAVFKIGLFLLFLAVIGRMLRFVLWGPAWRFGMAGPRFMRGVGYHRAAHWQRMHGPVPPWCWGWWEEPREEQTKGVEPEADTGKSEA